jgi:glycine/sarcosine N-methyltransferase
MDQTTDAVTQEGVVHFYDNLAAGYDLMTGFEARFVKERPFFPLLVDTYKIRQAVDAGAGTGFHSLLLAQLGVQVTALDISPRMLEVLAGHAADMKLSINTVTGPLTEAGALISGTYDAVFSLGNTLAHCLSAESLRQSLASLYGLLRPGGILFAQVLNYRRILVAREQILQQKEIDGVRVTRRYDYPGSLIRFSVIREDLRGGKAQEVEGVDLYPLLETELVAVLRETGYEEIRMFGGISMEPYDAGASKDLVVLAQKK